MAMKRGRNRKALIYVRQSTWREESISAETQIEHCLNYCEREGLEVVAEPIMDLNLSGRSFKLRSIDPIIERVKQGEARVVVVWKWSRWGRNVYESLKSFAELKQAGGMLEAATEPIDASTPVGRMSITNMLSIAEFQSDTIGEQWKDAKLNMIFSKGLPPTGGRRFGYIYTPKVKTYEKHPIAGPALARAYELFTEGRSFRYVTQHLRDSQVLSSTGLPISEASVVVALDSGFGAGLIKLDRPEALLEEERLEELGGEPGKVLYLPGKWEPVISTDVWMEYEARRDARRVLAPWTRNPRQTLDGRLRCAGCNKVMLYRPERNRWVCCSQRGKSSKDCPIKVTLDGKEALNAVRTWLEKMGSKTGESYEALVAQQMKRGTFEAGITDLEAARKKVDLQRENLISNVRLGIFTGEEVKAQLDEVRKEISRLDREIAMAKIRARREVAQPEEAPFDHQALLDMFDSAPVEIMNQALAAVVTVYAYPLRSERRVLCIGNWERDRDIPQAEAPDLDFTEGRMCLGCKTWKPRDQFYVRSRGNQLMSRCITCKAEAHRVWRDSRAVS